TEDEVDEEDRNQDDGDMDNEDDIYNEDIDDAYSRYERENGRQPIVPSISETAKKSSWSGKPITGSPNLKVSFDI
ncbi:unnamed protein product, partial [Didymodactylos carnosus]